MPGAAPRGDTGLGRQAGQTKSAFGRLFGAHVALLKAEIGEIVDQLKLLGTLAAVALALLLLMGNMLYIGGFLFVGEWLFGSIGWGLAHGVLLALALVVVVLLVMVGAGRGSILAGFVVGLLTAVGIGLLLGFNVANELAAQVAGGLVAPLDSAGAVAAIGGAIVVGLLFMLLMWRAGGLGGGITGLIVGGLIGALLGWLAGAVAWSWPPALGLSITLGLLLWPLMAAALALPGLDVGERFSRLYPRQSIEAANETKAWLEDQWQRRRRKLGKS